jgi:GT2 family glycosyltransferase
VLFTDDDTLATQHWVMAASARLRDHPAEVAVEGPVTTPAYDPLRAYSVAVDRAGHYWTCNIAYRRAVLEQLGGFAEDAFPYAHCEDRDLAFRALDLGPIGFAPDMSVVHTPREQSVLAFVRRGRWIASEIELARRHPTRVPRSGLPLPRTLDLLVGNAANWWRRWHRERDVLLSEPRSLGRFIVTAAGHMAVALAVVLKGGRSRSPPSVDVLRRRHPTR